MTFKNTINCCFAGYVVQAAVNNFLPLIFLTLQGQYRLPLSQPRVALLTATRRIAHSHASRFTKKRVAFSKNRPFGGKTYTFLANLHTNLHTRNALFVN